MSREPRQDNSKHSVIGSSQVPLAARDTWTLNEPSPIQQAFERIGADTSPVGAGPVSMQKVTSHFGIFEATSYTESDRGVDIELRFKPSAAVHATKIGLPQAIRAVARGSHFVIDPTQEAYMVPRNHAGARYMIDGMPTGTSPIYGSESVASGDLKDIPETNNRTTAATSRYNASYQLGHRFTASGMLKIQDAWMHDCPRFDRVPNSSMIFETAALALDGAQKGTYYGSVRWGWETDHRGAMKKLDLELISAGVPSANFLAAANQWNSARARGTVVTAADPTAVYDGSLEVVGMLPKGTRVEIDHSASIDGINYNLIRIAGDPDSKWGGYIKTADLKDLGDGPINTQLPVVAVQVLSNAQQMNDGVPGQEKRTLPQGTRVVKVGLTLILRSKTLVLVKVADGPDIGAQGYVESANLTPELP